MGFDMGLLEIHYLGMFFLYLSIGLFFIKRNVFLILSFITIILLLFDFVSVTPIQNVIRAGFTLNKWAVEIKYVQPLVSR